MPLLSLEHRAGALLRVGDVLADLADARVAYPHLEAELFPGPGLDPAEILLVAGRHVHGHELEIHGSSALELREDLQEHDGVLSARHRHENPVTVPDHAKVVNSGPGLAQDPFFKISSGVVIHVLILITYDEICNM